MLIYQYDDLIFYNNVKHENFKVKMTISFLGYVNQREDFGNGENLREKVSS